MQSVTRASWSRETSSHVRCLTDEVMSKNKIQIQCQRASNVARLSGCCSIRGFDISQNDKQMYGFWLTFIDCSRFSGFTHDPKTSSIDVSDSINWQDEAAVFNWWILHEVNGTIYSIFYHCFQLETANRSNRKLKRFFVLLTLFENAYHLWMCPYTFSMDEICFARRNNNNFRFRLPQTCEHVTIRMMWFLICMTAIPNSGRLFCMP